MRVGQRQQSDKVGTVFWVIVWEWGRKSQVTRLRAGDGCRASDLVISKSHTVSVYGLVKRNDGQQEEIEKR